MLDRTVMSNTATVVAACERRIAELETDRLILAEKRETMTKPKHTWKKIFDLGMSFQSNP